MPAQMRKKEPINSLHPCKINVFEKIISAIPSVSNSLDPEQAQHFVGPDLGSNRLQRSSADDSSVERVK